MKKGAFYITPPVYKLYERIVNALYTWKIVQQQRFESGQDVVRPTWFHTLNIALWHK